MIQQRLRKEFGGDGRWYNPNRDIAYCWQYLVKAAVSKLDEVNWQPWLYSYLKYRDTNEDHLAQAVEAYTKYMALYCLDKNCSSPKDALEKSGWFDVKDSAQAALLMVLGQVMTCAFFAAIREVSCDEEKHLDSESINEVCQKYVEYLKIGRFRRWRNKVVKMLSGLVRNFKRLMF